MTEICCASPQMLPKYKNMEVGNVKNTNKRGVNWRKEEVATLLGLWQAFSNKQGAKDPTYKNADVAIFTVLSIEMKEQGGYDRSADQIRRKIKKIRATYRQVIAGVHTSYSITKCCGIKRITLWPPDCVYDCVCDSRTLCL